MSSTQAFQQTGKSFTLIAGVAVSSTPIRSLTDLGLNQLPQCFRMVNNGNADVWCEFDAAAQAGTAFPVATAGGATGIPNGGGTTAKGFRLKPGVVEIFTLNAAAPAPGVAVTNGTPEPGFYINLIAAAAAQNVDFMPGEGL